MNQSGLLTMRYGRRDRLSSSGAPSSTGPRNGCWTRRQSRKPSLSSSSAHPPAHRCARQPSKTSSFDLGLVSRTVTATASAHMRPELQPTGWRAASPAVLIALAGAAALFLAWMAADALLLIFAG